MSSNDTNKRKRDLIVEYWVSCPYHSMENELIIRVKKGMDVTSFHFSFLGTGCIVVDAQDDHGNEAFQAALDALVRESDGHSRPVKIIHLLAKETHAILMNTIPPDIQQGISKLQSAAAIIIPNKDEFRLILFLTKQ
eukprot:12309689-Ditylum_brightwellii.AAC.1